MADFLLTATAIGTLFASNAVIEIMRQTGLDISSRYKETSTGGLAVNVPEC